jgi:hypothetical protein
MTSTAIRIERGKLSSEFFISSWNNRTAACSSTQNPKLKISSGTRCDGQHLAALVKSARGTDAVWNVWLGTLRTFADLRQCQHAVISAALTHPAFRRFTFWDAHKF